MLIYIRHAEDADGSYDTKHDGKLTPDGKKATEKLAKRLIKKYGYPDIIYCSPLYRTRQTAKIIQDITPHKVEVLVDMRLSKYFTTSQKNNPRVRRDTGKYHPQYYETKEDVKKRSRLQLKRMKKHREKYNIWCITHAIVFKYICAIQGQDYHGDIPFLEYTVS